MALLLIETVGLTVLFALPRFREGEFGGKIKVNATDFPADRRPAGGEQPGQVLDGEHR